MTPVAANATVGMVGLFLFLGFFVIVVAFLLRPGAKAAAERDARIPFKEDDTHG